MPLVTRTTTAGNLYKQDAEPDDKTDGAVWIDTNDAPNTINIATGTEYREPAIKIGGTVIPMRAMI